MTAAAFMERDDREPQAAIGHMPFPGHRTVAVVWAKQVAARRRERLLEQRAMQYGFDPSSIRKGEP